MKNKIKLGLTLIFLILITSIALAADWNTGVSYNVGDIVTYNGVDYECIQAHTSQVGWNPVVVPALWSEVVSTPDGNVWSSGVSYNVGDDVKYNNINYVVRQSHTSQLDWTPDITPALFLRDIEDTEKESLTDRLKTKYSQEFNTDNIKDISISAKYTVYDVTILNPETQQLENKIWIVEN